MKRLGYTKFVARGGDWGGIITDLMGAQAAPELLGIHTNFPGIFPPDIDKAIRTGGPLPSDLSDEERRAWATVGLHIQTCRLRNLNGCDAPTRCDRISRFTSGPSSLFLIDHDLRSYALIARSFDGVPEGLTPDDVLDNITHLSG